MRFSQRVDYRGMLMASAWALFVCASLVEGRADDKPAEAEAIPQPIASAIIPFQERGAKDVGAKVTDLLFAELVAKPEMYLVDREDFDKTVGELGVNLTGAVNPNQAIQVGQLVGARILITGSVIRQDANQYLIAKIIGTETSRVEGASVKGKVTDDLGGMVAALANEIATKVSTKAGQLVAKTPKKEDLLEELNKKLGDKKRPSLVVTVKERHVARIVIDPAAQTELELMAKQTGFELVQKVDDEKPNAEIMLVGEGFSEFAGRIGNIVSVKARLEVKAVERRTGKVLAVDRQTAVVLDLTEQIAGKTALQEAAAKIAERMLPKLVAP